MAYPERKPIYEAYESIVKEIIDSKRHREYAESEIKELDKSLMEVLDQIKIKLLFNKEWPDQ